MSEDISVCAEDVSNWIYAVEGYVVKTNASRLDLTYSRIPFGALETLLTFLPQSQVTELMINGIELCQEMNTFSELIKRTKVKKLSIQQHRLTCVQLVELAKVLNDSQIVDLIGYSGMSDCSDVVKGRDFVSYILQSPLTKLTCSLFHLIDEVGALAFVDGLPNTSLTCLYILRPIASFYLSVSPKVLFSLFTKLPLTQIKDLHLTEIRIDVELIKILSENLAVSNVENLDFFGALMGDASLDVLSNGLVDSKVTVLNLSYNQITGSNNFGQCLKNTRIRVLNLSHNPIQHRQMFNLNDFLKGSCVESLDISFCFLDDGLSADLIKTFKSTQLMKLSFKGNRLGAKSIPEIAVLKDICIKDIEFSYNDLPEESYDLLNSWHEAHLIRIKFRELKEKTIIPFLGFVENIKNSQIISIEVSQSNFSSLHAHHFMRALMNSTLTHLTLCLCNLDDIFDSFTNGLKYSSITHLNLSLCKIGDEHVQLFGQHLKETKIMELNMSDNQIKFEGARVLARCCPQSSIINLNLRSNMIDDDGLEILAEHLAGSLVTTLYVDDNPGKRTLLVDKILWENRVLLHNTVAFFKRVFSVNNFCFHQAIHDMDVVDFLEECLQFHKTVIKLPAVMSVLLQEESVSLSREELIPLLYDKFPREFVEFISNWVEADVAQHVEFLQRADELNLEKVVEHLLLLRPLYTIDDPERILHPYVYTLLLKYKQPICNLDIEPAGIKRISEYFKKGRGCFVEGAQNVVNLLSKCEISAETVAGHSLSS